MNNIKDLVSEYAKKYSRKNTLEKQKEFWWARFMENNGYESYKTFHKLETECKQLGEELLSLEEAYDALKDKISVNSNNYYAVTIGSAEKDDTGPCLDLWKRFVGSADGKDFVEKKAYFERGDNGYIHIHALVEKTKGWSMSMPKLRKRYGNYKGKQHNFDIKRLKGVGIKKWENYIKKDSKNAWNMEANNLFL